MPESSKIQVPRWLLILIIGAVIIPLTESAVGFFFDTKDAAVQHLEERLDKEILRLEKQQSDHFDRLDDRTEKLVALTEQLNTKVDILTQEINRLRDRQ